MDYLITIALGLGFTLIMASAALVRTMSRGRADVARAPARSAMPFRNIK